MTPVLSDYIRFESYKYKKIFQIISTSIEQLRTESLIYKRNLILILFIGISAVFLGLLSASTNLMMISLGSGVIFGPLFLVIPELTVWVILIIGFLFGVLSANQLFSQGIWVVSFLSILLLIPSIFNMFWNKQRRVPFFILIALLTLVYSLVISIIQGHSILEVVAGFKRYFQSFGLMIALTMIKFTPQSYVRWRKFLMIVALLQFPFALYELLVLVPLRGGLAYSSETTDLVAGSFGANLMGGSPSSVMVIYLFMTLSFLVARWRVGLINNWFFYSSALICLLPLGMGETKIAIIMLPIVGLILVKDDFIKAPLNYLFFSSIIILLTGLLVYIYVSVIMHTSLDDFIYGTIEYNFGNKGYSTSQSLNRFTSITFWAQQQRWNDPMGLIIGNGLGSSYYTSNDGNSGFLGIKYGHYGIDMTAVSALLWDTGLVGLLFYTSIFFLAWRSAGQLHCSVSDPGVKADALAIQATVALFILSLFYTNSTVNLMSMELIYAIVLGYLGYLLNNQRVFDSSKSLTPLCNKSSFMKNV